MNELISSHQAEGATVRNTGTWGVGRSQRGGLHFLISWVFLADTRVFALQSCEDWMSSVRWVHGSAERSRLE